MMFMRCRVYEIQNKSPKRNVPSFNYFIILVFNNNVHNDDNVPIKNKNKKHNNNKN